MLHRPRGKATNNTRRYRIFCDTCDFFLANLATNFLKNKRNLLCQKYKLFKTVGKVINGDIAYNSTDKAKKFARGIITTNSANLRKEGRDLKAKVVAVKFFNSAYRSKTKQPKTSSEFIRNKFLTFYENQGILSMTVCWVILLLT